MEFKLETIKPKVEIKEKGHCPHCNNKIDCLSYYENRIHFGTCTMDRGSLDFEEDNSDYEEESLEFTCPDCCETIFTGENAYEEAIEFLKD
jgi:C4-type Zn-finger protein